MGDDHGVGRRHRDTGRLVEAERGHAVGDDPLIDERARGVMQQHAAVGRIGAVRGDGPGDRGQGHPGRVRPGRAALDDGPDLAVAAVREHRPDLLDVPARHEHEGLVNARGLLEGGYAVLDQGPAGQFQQLFRQRRADPLAGAAAQHRRDHPHAGTLTHRGRPFCRGVRPGTRRAPGVFLQGSGQAVGYIG
jgi:hypothetical protein